MHLLNKNFAWHYILREQSINTHFSKTHINGRKMIIYQAGLAPRRKVCIIPDGQSLGVIQRSETLTSKLWSSPRTNDCLTKRQMVRSRENWYVWSPSVSETEGELSRGGDQPFGTLEKKVKVIKVIWSTNCCWRVLSTTHQLQKGHCVPRAFELAWVNSVVPSQRLTVWQTDGSHIASPATSLVILQYAQKGWKMSLRGNKGRKRGRNTPS